MDVAAEGKDGDRFRRVWRIGGGVRRNVAPVNGVRQLTPSRKLIAGVEKTSVREEARVVAASADAAPPPSSVTLRGSAPAEMATVAA